MRSNRAPKFTRREDGIRGRRGAWIDGAYFPSKGEAARYMTLKLYAAAGYLFDLQLQVPFPLLIVPLASERKGPPIKLGTWKADFAYKLPQVGEPVIVYEDYKGNPIGDRLGNFRRRLVEALYGVTIHVITDANAPHASPEP